MRTIRTLRMPRALPAILLLSTLPASAADLAGVWEFTLAGPEHTFTRRLTLGRKAGKYVAMSVMLACATKGLILYGLLCGYRNIKKGLRTMAEIGAVAAARPGGPQVSDLDAELC